MDVLGFGLLVFATRNMAARPDNPLLLLGLHVGRVPLAVAD